MPLNDFLENYRNAMSGSGDDTSDGPEIKSIDTGAIQKRVDQRLRQEQVDSDKAYQKGLRDAKTRRLQSIKDAGLEVVHDADGNPQPRQAKQADGTMENVRRKFGTDIYKGENSGDYYQPDLKTGQLAKAVPRKTTDKTSGTVYNDYGRGFKTVDSVDPDILQRKSDTAMLTQAHAGLVDEYGKLQTGKPDSSATSAYNKAKADLDAANAVGMDKETDPDTAAKYQQKKAAFESSQKAAQALADWNDKVKANRTARSLILDHQKMIGQGQFTPELRKQYQDTLNKAKPQTEDDGDENPQAKDQPPIEPDEQPDSAAVAAAAAGQPQAAPAPPTPKIPDSAAKPVEAPQPSIAQNGNPNSTGQQAAANAKAAGNAIQSPTELPQAPALNEAPPKPPKPTDLAPPAPAPMNAPAPTPVGGIVQPQAAASPPLVVAKPEAVEDMTDTKEIENYLSQSNASLAQRNVDLQQRQQQLMAPFQQFEQKKAQLDAANAAAIQNGDDTVQMQNPDGSPAFIAEQFVKSFQKHYQDYNDTVTKLKPQMDQWNADQAALKADSNLHDQAVETYNGKIAAERKAAEEERQSQLQEIRSNPLTAKHADILESLDEETKKGASEIADKYPEGDAREAAIKEFEAQQKEKFDAVHKNIAEDSNPAKLVKIGQELLTAKTSLQSDEYIDPIDEASLKSRQEQLEKQRQEIISKYGLTQEQASKLEAETKSRPYSFSDKGGLLLKPFGENGTPDPAQAQKALSAAEIDGAVDGETASEIRNNLDEAKKVYDDIVKRAGSNTQIKAILKGVGGGGAFMAGAELGTPVGASVGARAGALVGPEAIPIGTAVGGVFGGLTGGFASKKVYDEVMDKLGDYFHLIDSVNSSEKLNPVASSIGELASFGLINPKNLAGLLKPSTWTKTGGVADALTPPIIKSMRNYKEVANIAMDAVGKAGESATVDAARNVAAAKALMQNAAGATGGAALFTAGQYVFDAGKYALSPIIGQQEKPNFDLGNLATNIGLGLLLHGQGIEFKDYSEKDVASILTRAKTRQDAGIPLDMTGREPEVQKAFENAGVNFANDGVKKEMLSPLTKEEIDVYRNAQQKINSLRGSGASGISFEGGARQASVPGIRGRNPVSSAAIEPRFSEEASSEEMPEPAPLVGDNVDLAASDAELENSEASTDDVARARTIRDIVTGTKIQDMTEGELNSVGLTRPQGSNNIKALKDSTPAVHVDDKGNAIVLQPAIDEMKRQFPATANMVKMDEKEARAHFNAPEPTPVGKMTDAELQKEHEDIQRVHSVVGVSDAKLERSSEIEKELQKRKHKNESSTVAPVQEARGKTDAALPVEAEKAAPTTSEKADALEKAADHLEQSGKSHNVAPLRQEAAKLRSEKTADQPVEKSEPLIKNGDGVRQWLQSQALSHSNSNKVHLVADALDQVGHLFNSVKVSKTHGEAGIELNPDTGDLHIDPAKFVEHLNNANDNSVAAVKKRIGNILFEEKTHRSSTLLEKLNPEFASDLQALWESVPKETKEAQKLAYWKREGVNFPSDWHAKHEWWADVVAAAERGEIPHEIDNPNLKDKIVAAIKSYLKALKDWLANAPLEIKERFKRSIKALKELEEKLAKGEKPSEIDNAAHEAATSPKNKLAEPTDAPEEEKKLGTAPVKAELGLSAATYSIDGIRKLTQEAEAGDLESAQMLRNMARDSLTHLTKGIESAEVVANDATGLYGGSVEPSLGVSLNFDTKNRGKILTVIKQFAQNFNQEQVHLRQPSDDPVGTSYDDGSFVTPVYEWEAKNLTNKEINDIAQKSGLAGFTVANGKLKAYYAGNPHDLEAFQQFQTATIKASDFLGGNASTIDRLWIYGRGQNAIPFEEIDGDIHSEKVGASVTAGRIASRLAKRSVVPVQQAEKITPEQAALQTKISDEYEKLRLNALDDLKVRKAYDELAHELVEQYDSLPVKVEVLSGQGEPYKNSGEMRRDVLDRNHLYIFGTDPKTFGPEGIKYDDHPLLRDSGKKDINGKPLLMNDLLRAVHDYFAHTMSPVEFGPKGEEAAWRNHMAMTKSPWARWALTSETRGQNSYVNFGPNAEWNHTHKNETIFAPQKVDLLPVEYAKTGDSRLDKEMDEAAKSSLGTAPAVSKEDDARYLELAKDPEKNREELQRMVDEAAKEAGFVKVDRLKGEGAPSGFYLHEIAKLGDLEQTEGAVRHINNGTFEELKNSLEGVSPKDVEPLITDAPDENGKRQVFNGNHRVEIWRHYQGLPKATEVPVLGFWDESSPITRDSQGNIIPLSERFNPESNSILHTAPATDKTDFVEPGFFSQLSRTVADKMPNVATKEQAKSIIEKGSKAEEVKWSGVIPWLDAKEGKISKAELLDYLKNEGSVKFEEHRKGDTESFDIKDNKEETDFAGERMVDVVDKRNGFTRFTGTPEEARNWISENNTINQSGTKYSRYQLPGGQNYREVVLAMPEKGGVKELSKSEALRQLQAGKPVTAKAVGDVYQGDEYDVEGPDDLKNFPTEGEERYRFYGVSSEDLHLYTSSHFSHVPNYVAHMRLNDRTDADGKPGLFMEELQSDRHQQGREKGYSENTPVWGVYVGGHKHAEFDNEATARERAPAIANSFGANKDQVEVKQTGASIKTEGIPDAPFRSTWPLQLFKRALREAVDTGKQWLGWTTGQAHTDRWGSERIEWKEKDDSHSDPVIAVKDGHPSISKGIWKSLRKLGSISAKDIETRGKDKILEYEAAKWGVNPSSLEIRQPDRAFFVHAKSQHGGNAGGIDLENEANARNLNPENSTIIRSKQELIDAIKPSLTEGQDPEKLGEKLWNRMQTERAGVSFPRKEGFEGFYDNILPKEIGKYVKQWGGKVEKGAVGGNAKIEQRGSSWQVTLSDGDRQKFANEDSAREWARKFNPDTTPIWRIDITPEMSASVKAGQPLFTAPSGNDSPSYPDWLTPPTKEETDSFNEQKAKDAQNKADVPPGETTPSYLDGPVANQNAWADAYREEKDFAEREKIVVPDKELWKRAQRQVSAGQKRGTDVGEKLIQDVIKKNRALAKDEEGAILSYELTKRNQEFEAASLAKEAAPSDLVVEQRYARAKDRMEAALRASDIAGEHAGRIFRFRRMGIGEDYSLAGLMKAAKTAKGGDLAPVEEDEIRKQHRVIVRLQTDIDRIAALEKQNSELEKLLHQQKHNPVSPISSVKSSLKKMASDALTRLKQKFKLGTSPLASNAAEPEDDNFKDLSVYGAGLIEDGASDFNQFKASFEKELPGVLDNYDARKVYEAAKDFHKENSLSKTPARVVERIKTKRETSDKLTQNDLRKIALSLIQNENISDVEALTKRLHETVATIFPDLSEEQIAKLWTGVEGEPVYPNQEPAHKTLRDLRRQKIALQRMKMVRDEKRLPNKIGPQREEPSDKAREYERQLADLVKDSGLKSADPATQLKSTQDRIVTALTHRRDDLKAQIAAGKREVRSVATTPETPEMARLRKEIEELNDKLDKLDPRKTGMTEAQKIKMAEHAALRSLDNIDKDIAELEKLVKAGSVSGPPVKPKGKELSSPALADLRKKLEAKRELRDDLRNKLEDLRDAAAVKQDPVADMLKRLKVRQNNQNVPLPPRIKSHLELLAESYISDPSKDFVTEAQKFGVSKIESEQAKIILDAERERRFNMMERAAERRLERSIAYQEKRQQAFDSDNPLLKKSKKTVQLSDSLNKLRNQLDQAKLATKKSQRIMEMRNRKWWDKGGALTAKVTRTNLLTNLGVFAKLAANAASRIVLTPIMDLGPGTVVNNLLPGLADASPRFRGEKLGPLRLGINLEGEKAAWSLRPSSETVARSITDALKRLFQAHLESLNEGHPSQYKTSKPTAYDLDPSIVELFHTIKNGNSMWERTKAVANVPMTLVPHSHAFVKTTPWLQEYWRTFENHVQWLISRGEDATAPAALQAAGIRAVDYANRAILQQDNFFNTARSGALNGLRRFEGSAGSEFFSKTAGHIANTVEPITKVGTNLINDVVLSIIGLPVAVGEVLPHFVKAAIEHWKKSATPADALRLDKFLQRANDNLRVLAETPEGQAKADAIQRHARIGMLGWALIGAAIYAFGYGINKYAGGFFKRGEHPEKGNPKAEEFKIGDTNIGKAPSHTTPGMLLQAVASFERYVQNASDLSKKAIAKKEAEVAELTRKRNDAHGKEQEKYSEELRIARESLEQLKKEGDPAQLSFGAANVYGLFDTFATLINEIPHIKGMREILEATGDEPTSDAKLKRMVTSFVSPPVVGPWTRSHDLDASGDPIQRKMKSWTDYYKAQLPGLRQTLPIKGGNYDELGFPRELKHEPTNVEKAVEKYNEKNPYVPFHIPAVSKETLSKLPEGTEDVFRAKAGELIRNMADRGVLKKPHSKEVLPITADEAENPTANTVNKLKTIAEEAHRQAKEFVAKPSNVTQYQRKMAELRARLSTR